MKNIFYTIIMIALLAVAAFLVISPQKVDAPNLDEETVPEVLVDETTPEDTSYQHSLDLDRSEINWVAGKKFMTEYLNEGTIDLLSGGIDMSVSEAYEVELSGEIVLDMESITVTETGSGSGSDLLKDHLKGENFFDVDNYSTSKFIITDYSLEGASQIISGDLTIKGITKSISMTLSEWNEMDQYLVGLISIDRLDFGVGPDSEGLIGLAEDKIISDTFDLSFKIYYK
jgi:polyisoprenoid-binding protein YceI